MDAIRERMSALPSVAEERFRPWRTLAAAYIYSSVES